MCLYCSMTPCCRMVSGLTADIFVQLTTTLAHLSGLKNRTNINNDTQPFQLTPKGKRGSLAA